MATTSAVKAVMIITGAVLVLCSVHIDATKVWNDVENCGSCEHKCPRAPPHGERTCKRGRCGFKCTGAWRDCDETRSNGCEVNVKTDLQNCGSCGNVCPEPPAGGFGGGRGGRGGRGGGSDAVATCVNGACGLRCDGSGFADCDGIFSNGCEQDVWYDNRNCGGCNNVCGVPPNSVSAVCQSGSCGYLSCNAGFADCDGVARNGCERILIGAVGAGETCGTCTSDSDCIVAAPAFPYCSVLSGASSGTCTPVVGGQG